MKEYAWNTTFRWRGDPIRDIRAWVRERGEQFVHFRMERDMPNSLTGQLDHEEHEGSMPESFWDNLRIDGWRYTELGRGDAPCIAARASHARLAPSWRRSSRRW